MLAHVVWEFRCLMKDRLLQSSSTIPMASLAVRNKGSSIWRQRILIRRKVLTSEGCILWSMGISSYLVAHKSCCGFHRASLCARAVKQVAVWMCACPSSIKNHQIALLVS